MPEHQCPYHCERLGIGQYPAHVTHEYLASRKRRVQALAQHYRMAFQATIAELPIKRLSNRTTEDDAVIDAEFRELPNEQQPALPGGDATPIQSELFGSQSKVQERSQQR